ncbi:MAG: M56 family metallopeptidase [Oscillospiraceae bacterium]|nr:M56 family metallopeptidase [Oscillospiraceae bacterium]
MADYNQPVNDSVTMPSVINVSPVVNTLNGVSGGMIISQTPQFPQAVQPQDVFSQPIISDVSDMFQNYTIQGSLPSSLTKCITYVIEKMNITRYTAIWLVGIFAFGIFFIIPHTANSRKYKAALPSENEYIDSWVKSHRLRRKYKVMLSDEIVAPFTYGLFRPVILLPANIDTNNRDLVDYILTHEYTHIKRFDVVLKWLSAVTLCINWFNPLVWVMYILMNRDIELSCDERVIRLKGEANKKSYAMTLLDMESNKASFHPLVNHFNKNSLKERITAIMKIKKITVLSIMLAVVFLMSSTLILVSSCSDKASNTQNTTAVKTTEPATIPAPTEDPYANVRFGDTRDTLLLDVEWYTDDEYEQEVVEPYRESISEYKNTDEYAKLSDEDKKQFDINFSDTLQIYEKNLNNIKNKIFYISKTVNGKSVEDGGGDLSVSSSGKSFDISQDCDSNGYYIFNVYPYFSGVYYYDDNGVLQSKTFGTINNKYVNSKYEYDYVLENEIIPYCDDLLTKGLITQRQYDIYTIKDPLDYYVKLYFS